MPAKSGSVPSPSFVEVSQFPTGLNPGTIRARLNLDTVREVGIVQVTTFRARGIRLVLPRKMKPDPPHHTEKATDILPVASRIIPNRFLRTAVYPLPHAELRCVEPHRERARWMEPVCPQSDSRCARGSLHCFLERACGFQHPLWCWCLDGIHTAFSGSRPLCLHPRPADGGRSGGIRPCCYMAFSCPYSRCCFS